MYNRYSLTLMLTHDCNLRCSYCYMGAKSGRVMPESLGRKAIDRAIASLEDKGELELGFFGGEPLLEPALLGSLIKYAQLAPDFVTFVSISCSKSRLQLNIEGYFEKVQCSA